MNIYFTASARASLEDKKDFDLIYSAIQQLGHKHVDDYKINSDANTFYNSTDEYKQIVYQQALDYVKNSDLVILEVSTHSLTMGYLIKHALDTHTPVIALHKKNHSPGFILGIDENNFQLIEYTHENLKTKLENAIEFLKNLEDVRFNMMLSPEVYLYLSEEAKKANVSKAHFIRNLLLKNKAKKNR